VKYQWVIILAEFLGNTLKLNIRKLLFVVVVAVSALVFGTSQASAQTTIMTIAKKDTQINHYPGPDGLIGNADDVVSSDLTTTQSSAPNANGSYGHNSFLFVPFGPQDPELPIGFDAITFVEGTVAIDVDVLTNGGAAIISAMNITSGTEPFPGHGAYTSTVTAVNSGTYNQVTKEFTLNVDFSYTINGSDSAEPGVTLTGTAIYQESADFGTPTGNDYFDNVVVPLAQAEGAASAVFITGTGQLTNLGFPISTSIVALDTGVFEINPGLNDAWVSEDAPFQGFFFTVFADIKLFFLSWFTFDSEVPAGEDTAVFGAFDQRWVTASGFFDGNTVPLNVELTSGGVFNASVPLASQDTNYGTITIVFISCNEAILTYNFPSLGLSGQMTLTRVVDDNVALCETLAEG
jgi:hypothetical protein